MRKWICLFLLPILLNMPAAAQTAAPKNTTAASLLGAAVKSLTQGVPVSSVTLAGAATRTAGSDVETGLVTLAALNGAGGRIDMALTEGRRSEIINQLQRAPVGQWSGPDGTPYAMALHNCWVPADWFFPALALSEALNDPTVALGDLGVVSRDGVAVRQLRFLRVPATQQGAADAVALIQRLSAVDVYLSTVNGLPVALDFNLHPDDNAAIDLAVEIRYGSYQQLNGILLPTHIEKLVNNSLALDLSITSLTLNPGLSPADFAVTATSGGPQ